MASLNNHDNLVALLLESGADVDIKNEVIAITAAFEAVVFTKSSHKILSEQIKYRSFIYVFLFFFQFGKGALEMARGLNRQVQIYYV